jgi:hypothetical protein
LPTQENRQLNRRILQTNGGNQTDGKSVWFLFFEHLYYTISCVASQVQNQYIVVQIEFSSF